MNIERNVYKALADEISKPDVSILQGSRQVGKTFLLNELKNEAEKQGKRVQYFNLEIPADLVQFNATDVIIFETLTRDTDVLSIDEFHYLQNASHLFKAIYDSDCHVKIFASGSSSIEMHKHLKESLAGRRRLTKIYPLTFDELQQTQLEYIQLLEAYLLYGGLPGLLHLDQKEEKIRLLAEIYATYIQKDIKSLIKEENIRSFNMLLSLIATYQGSLISVNKIANEVGLTARTIEKYLEILEQTFIVYSVSSYSRNMANELKKSRKIYLYDLGIRNAILKNFSAISERADIGAMVETFVVLQIIPLLRPNMELKFWRDKAQNEIDFVLLEDNKPCIIEVKTTLKEAVIPKAMKIFIDHYPETRFGVVFSMNFTGQAEYKDKTIFFKTLNEVKNLL